LLLETNIPPKIILPKPGGKKLSLPLKKPSRFSARSLQSFFFDLTHEQFTTSIGLPLLIVRKSFSFDPLDLPASPLAVTSWVYLRRKLCRLIDMRMYYTHRNAVTSDTSNCKIIYKQKTRSYENLVSARESDLTFIWRISLVEKRKGMSNRVIRHRW